MTALIAFRFYFVANNLCKAVFGLTSSISVNWRSAFLALCFFTGTYCLDDIGLLLVSSSVVDTMADSIIALYSFLSSHSQDDLYPFLGGFPRHICSYKALLFNDWTTRIFTICCLSRYVCNNPLKMTHWFSNESISIILSITLVNTHDLAHCSAWALLPSFWKQIHSFSGVRLFLAGASFSLIIYVLVLFL